MLLVHVGYTKYGIFMVKMRLFCTTVALCCKHLKLNFWWFLESLKDYLLRPPHYLNTNHHFHALKLDQRHLGLSRKKHVTCDVIITWLEWLKIFNLYFTKYGKGLSLFCVVIQLCILFGLVCTCYTKYLPNTVYPSGRVVE